MVSIERFLTLFHQSYIVTLKIFHRRFSARHETIITYPTNITRDQSALLKFKSKINDPEGHLEDWNPNKTVCEWRGVKCGVNHYRVIALDVSELYLMN
ncbi:hypothetical protein Leryth_013973 [Lithospermum erythrorhizon]|nr:hypothetical protein Leryth_013973 [Lithospermum erythrorhizon]